MTQIFARRRIPFPAPLLFLVVFLICDLAVPVIDYYATGSQ